MKLSPKIIYALYPEKSSPKGEKDENLYDEDDDGHKDGCKEGGEGDSLCRCHLSSFLIDRRRVANIRRHVEVIQIS